MSDLDDVLKVPVMAEQTDSERKIKNNLIAFSFISLFMYFGGVDISTDSSILGLKFTGLTQEKINIALFLMVLYSTFHYLWYIKDAFANWHLRLTATLEMKAGLYGSFASVLELEDKRNNTIYHWWSWHKKQFSQIHITNNSLIKSIEKIESYLDCSNNAGSISEFDINDILRTTTGGVNSLSDELKDCIKLFNTSPIEASLMRFNSSFRAFIVSQNIRWLIFELIFPFALSLASLFCLSINIYG